LHVFRGTCKYYGKGGGNFNGAPAAVGVHGVGEEVVLARGDAVRAEEGGESLGNKSSIHAPPTCQLDVDSQAIQDGVLYLRKFSIGKTAQPLTKAALVESEELMTENNAIASDPTLPSRKGSIATILCILWIAIDGHYESCLQNC
jgi:hypothetical protein